jgi:D-serine dehydratase
MSAPMLLGRGRIRRPAVEGSSPPVATRRCTPPGVAFAYVDAPNILREDLPLPVCVLRASALERNLVRFQQFSEAAGVLLCPHAKTTMAPALFRRQLAAGSWGLTFATGPQVRAAREHGVPRIFYANELVGAADIRYVCAELRRDPGFEFYCLVDSPAGVRLLAERVAGLGPDGPGRPVNVLVEGGLAGARCGVRDVTTAVGVAEAVRAAAPHLALVGVEGFEGLARARDDGDREPVVREFLAFLVQIATALDQLDLFDVPEVLLTAGGTAFPDVVIDVLTGARLSRPTQVMLRSGCYLSEDWGLYARALAELHTRTGSGAPDLEPALEVWAQVLSVPEPGLVILSAGRRDFGQDAGNPVALTHVPRGTAERRPLRDAGWTMAAVSDQHAHLAAPPGHGVAVGDLVALGPSHPCTTFDKWRTLYLVDDAYTVTEEVSTFF